SATREAPARSATHSNDNRRWHTGSRPRRPGPRHDRTPRVVAGTHALPPSPSALHPMAALPPPRFPYRHTLGPHEVTLSMRPGDSTHEASANALAAVGWSARMSAVLRSATTTGAVIVLCARVRLGARAGPPPPVRDL